MHENVKRKRLLLPTILVLAAALGATAAVAQTPPAASATPAEAATAGATAPEATPAATGGKTRPGCCCYPNDKVPGGWACTWGWQESRCAAVAADLKKVGAGDGRFKWNEGRCSSPSAADSAAD